MSGAPVRPAGAALLTAATMVFFAANSWLARWALRGGEVDGITFTGVRLFSGALALLALAGARRGGGNPWKHGSWSASLALFVYALAFSLAYVWIDAGVGALILFAAVQATMIGGGIRRGEWPSRLEWSGLALSLGGLAYLTAPGAGAPPAGGAALMAAAGAAWGWYSLAAKGVRHPAAATAGNFLRACPPAAAALAAVWLPGRGWGWAHPPGLALAAVSGSITSGLGYVLWYTVFRRLGATRAAVVQLTVPAIAAAGGAAFLGEDPAPRLLPAAAAILGGAGLAMSGRRGGGAA